MGSLQDALRRSGLVREKDRAETGKKPQGKKHRGRKAQGRHDQPGTGRPVGTTGRKAPGTGGGTPGAKGPGRPAGESDLARAWAARRRAEKAEAEREKQARLADQEARRKRNLELDRLIEGRSLNVEHAEVPRYFEHIGRVRRVLCTPEQREAINAGRLGIVGLRGRYHIVDPETVAAWRETAPDLVPDLSGREPEEDLSGDYPPVPDDLTW